MFVAQWFLGNQRVRLETLVARDAGATVGQGGGSKRIEGNGNL